MAGWLACEYVTNDDLLRGGFEGADGSAVARPMPAPPPLDGARHAAERILAAV